jgi:excisionase family DNA binding protein
MSKHQQSVMTIDELAEYLKVAKSTLYKLAQTGRIPGQKVGKHWRFHQGVIDGWLGERRDIDVGGRKPRS